MNENQEKIASVLGYGFHPARLQWMKSVDGVVVRFVNGIGKSESPYTIEEMMHWLRSKTDPSSTFNVGMAAEDFILRCSVKTGNYTKVLTVDEGKHYPKNTNLVTLLEDAIIMVLDLLGDKNTPQPVTENILAGEVLFTVPKASPVKKAPAAKKLVSVDGGATMIDVDSALKQTIQATAAKFINLEDGEV